MARIRWVMATLREWAAWVENPVSIKTPKLDGSPGGGQPADNWLPRDLRSVRRTHKAVCQLAKSHVYWIVLVYIKGPRYMATTLPQIANMEGMEEGFLRKELETAERAFAERLEALDPDDDAMD